MLVTIVGAATLLLACHELTEPIRSFFIPAASQYQNGTGTVTVYPGNMHGWSFYRDNTHAACADATCTMVAGPTGQPLGTGSAQLTTTTTTDGRSLTIADYKGVKFSTITQLDYWTYRTSTTGAAKAIKLQVDVDYDLTDSDVSDAARLNYEPSIDSAEVPSTRWQHWDAKMGTFWWSPAATVIRGGVSVANPCLQATPCSWTKLLATFPNIGLHATSGALYLRAGPNWAQFKGNVDAFSIGINGTTTTFDFELTGHAAVPAQAPDSVPSLVWDTLVAAGNVMINPLHLRGTWIRNVVEVTFRPTATLAQRQAAIDLVNGEVVGGIPLGGAEKYYIVRIPYALAPGDSVSGPVLRAGATLRALPFIESAWPVNLDPQRLH